MAESKTCYHPHCLKRTLTKNNYCDIHQDKI